jgi:DNA-binding response OmpR family regulator
LIIKPEYIKRKFQCRYQGASILSTKILVVEDDELIQASILAILESEGYETYQAFNGTTAKKMTDRDFFNLILLDLNLPDTSGLELAKSLRDTKPRMKIILLTGYSNENLDSESIKNNVDAVIIKPYDIDVLLDTISNNLK